jgi:hypothetical protein
LQTKQADHPDFAIPSHFSLFSRYNDKSGSNSLAAIPPDHNEGALHMISTQLMKLAEMNQWKVNAKEDMIFGEYNGYLFTAFEGKRFKAFITPVAGISPDALEMIVKFLENQRKALKLRNYEIGDNFLCVRMEEGIIPISSEKMEFILGQLSGLLSLYEVPARSCVVCGQTAQRKGLYLGLFCHLHQDCEDKDMIDFTRADSDELAAAAPDDAAADGQPDAEATDEQPDAEATDEQPDAEAADGQHEAETADGRPDVPDKTAVGSPEEAVDMPVDDIDQESRKEGQES